MMNTHTYRVSFSLESPSPAIEMQSILILFPLFLQVRWQPLIRMRDALLGWYEWPKFYLSLVSSVVAEWHESESEEREKEIKVTKSVQWKEEREGENLLYSSCSLDAFMEKRASLG